jgi:hypothetical protein
MIQKDVIFVTFAHHTGPGKVSMEAFKDFNQFRVDTGETEIALLDRRFRRPSALTPWVSANPCYVAQNCSSPHSEVHGRRH